MVWNPLVRQIDCKVLFWVSYPLILVVELTSATGESEMGSNNINYGHFHHGGILLNLIRSEFLVFRMVLWKLIDEIDRQQGAGFDVLPSDFDQEETFGTGESTHKPIRPESSSNLREL